MRTVRDASATTHIALQADKLCHVPSETVRVGVLTTMPFAIGSRTRHTGIVRSSIIPADGSNFGQEATQEIIWYNRHLLDTPGGRHCFGSPLRVAAIRGFWEAQTIHGL